MLSVSDLFLRSQDESAPCLVLLYLEETEKKTFRKTDRRCRVSAAIGHISNKRIVLRNRYCLLQFM